MHNGSILPFFNAAGRCPLLVIILPLEFGDADAKAANVYILPERDMTPHHTRVLYTFTEKGYMTNDLFKLVMAELRRVIKLRHPDLEHLLYLIDCNLTSRRTWCASVLKTSSTLRSYPRTPQSFSSLRTQRRSRRCMQC